MEEKIEYTETINYVVTTQPDLVAGYIDELNERIAELEQELAELKEKAIVPRFKIGQRVWWIDKRLNNYNEKEYEIVSYLIDSIVVTNKQFRYYGNDGYWHGDDELYATEQEAQEKLKEIQGNE